MTEFSRDMIEVQRLLAIVKNSLEEFNKSEGFLIKNDLSERCICAKFSTYLERELLNTQYQDYNVDVEYNRGRGGNDSAAKMMNGKKIVTDLIVHKRGKNEEGEYKIPPYHLRNNILSIHSTLAVPLDVLLSLSVHSLSAHPDFAVHKIEQIFCYMVEQTISQPPRYSPVRSKVPWILFSCVPPIE